MADMDPNAFALREFDSLCKRSQEAGDMIPIVRDLIETLHNGFEGFEGEAESTDSVSLKLSFLGKNNPQILRLLSLFRSSTWGCSQWIDRFRYKDCDHLLSFMCITKSYHGIPSKDCFRLVLSVAPEAARFKEPTGKSALHNLVERNPCLEIVQMIVVAANKGFGRSDSILLAETPARKDVPIDDTFLGFVCQRIVHYAIRDGSYLDYSGWLDLLEYIIEDVGVHTLIVGKYIYQLSSMIYHVYYFGGMNIDAMATEKSTDLILKAACIEFEAFNGTKAPSSLYALVWSAEYLFIGADFNNSRIPNEITAIRDGSVLYTLLPQLITLDPIESRAVDDRMNTLLHVASASKWYDSFHSNGKLRGRSKYCWTKLLILLLEGDKTAASKKNSFGRLAIHIALANGMTWSEGVKVLFEAYPSALDIADPSTRLLPFMAAASAPFATASLLSLEETVADGVDALTTTYLLLREDPSFIFTHKCDTPLDEAIDKLRIQK